MTLAPPLVAEPKTEQRHRMTYEEFLNWADEDKHAEWVDGEVIEFMPPKTRHQLVASFVATLLNFYARFFQLGIVLTSPYEMKLSPDQSAREPDILFISQDHLSRLTDNKLEGSADLVVELISDDSVSRDRADKFYEYQDAGITEYWLIDPRPGKERVDFWVLDATGRYQNGQIDEQGIYRSTVLPGFWLKTPWLTELPDPFLTFAEIIDAPASAIAAFQQIANRTLLGG